MMRKIIFSSLITSMMLIGGCEQHEEEVPVSGPTYCKNFDFAAVESRAFNGDLDAMRKMREYAFDCRVTPDSAEIMRWAEMAAKHGDEHDVKELNNIRGLFLEDH